MFICSTLASMYHGAIVVKGFRKIIPQKSYLKKYSIQNNNLGGGKAGSVLDRKYRTAINWSELGQQCTLDGSTLKNDIWYCWLFRLELKYPNFTWEHKLLKLCTSWNNTRAVCKMEEQEPVLNAVTGIGSHCTSCSRTDVFLEQDIVWTEWEQKTDIGVPEFPCSS